MSISTSTMLKIRAHSMTCYATTRSARRETPAVIAGVFLILMLAACAPQDSSGVAGGTRWQPASNDDIVFTFAASASDETSLYALRRELSDNPSDAPRAALYAMTALKSYALSGDPRLLGYAAGALQNWQDVAAPPLDIWLLRGRLTQTEHRFADAAKDMDRLIAVHPGNAEALLLAADAWRRSGNVSAARGRCLALSLSGHDPLARLCAADVQLALGETAKAQTTAAQVISDFANQLDDEALAFAHAIHAEAATANGATDIALDSWAGALAATPQPPLALRLGRVDTLLEAKQYDAALRALDGMPEADAVLLRRAIAGTALQHPQLAAWRTALLQRFTDPAYTAEDSLHWRERALFELDVMQEPTSALRFAERNWAVQKGYEDAELLLRAAAAAGNDAAAQPVIAWRKAQGGAT
ncbi:MAG: hypothetical protein WBM68_03265 [Woeseia sp.]